eukprot:CAMPEP_0116870570 /NCGR_PEP_ID=MMETSP0463-20121206/505_1 /TAXON_ID=181622 /ORGANISM="Strombidinopsis sp, Strain SopsisLIS2011" /LENGTH=108 /DNA_ID=CAMNT_0004507293 /DNA_START=576 /DNA_END=899 /DNA_ORIENTATION=-
MEYAQISYLLDEMEKHLGHIKKEIREKLYSLMNYESKGIISEVEFFSIIKPWASFSATDINNDNELDLMELKCLLWLIDEKEPTPARVEREMKLIDDDKSGTIDRLEW